MDSLLPSKVRQPGVRFHPTDTELFMFYLKRKLTGKELCNPIIADVDVYQFPPWDLPSKSRLNLGDLNWFFYCPRSKKYAHGRRTNRSTKYGYWKSTGNDRSVTYRDRPVGKVKTLVFHEGKAPSGVRTNWVIHEYRMEDNKLAEAGVSQDAYVICKLYKKSGLGPKNGEDYGAPFVEEEWMSDNEDTIEAVSVGCNQNALHSQNKATSSSSSYSCVSALNSLSIPDAAFTQSTASLALQSQNVAVTASSAVPPALQSQNVVDTAPSTEQQTVGNPVKMFNGDEFYFPMDFQGDTDFWDMLNSDSYLELNDLL